LEVIELESLGGIRPNLCGVDFELEAEIVGSGRDEANRYARLEVVQQRRIDELENPLAAVRKKAIVANEMGR
jgi:hypothetical protein